MGSQPTSDVSSGNFQLDPTPTQSTRCAVIQNLDGTTTREQIQMTDIEMTNQQSRNEGKICSDYSIDHQKGWRRFRVLQPGKGMFYDVKRRAPFYMSDITDAFTYRTIASTIRIYFVNLLPALAYTLDMYRRTNRFYGINEALFSSALAGVVFSLLAAQPITIVGVTGLIALFNYTIYDIITPYEPSIYPQFMCWTAIWAAIMHWAVAIFNLCDYMRYVTDFSSEAFGMYVGIIYISKGIEELISEFEDGGSTAGYMSVMIALLYFGTIYGLEKIGSSSMFYPWIRTVIADYAYVFGTLFWVGFAYIPGPLRDTRISKIHITEAFHPTQNRNWIIPFWELDIGWIFVSIPFGFLILLLFYYDHNVSSLTAQAKQYPLKKPGGFHWDFFLLGCTTLIAGVFGIPLPNGLVPQAPVHTDSLSEYETTVEVIAMENVQRPEVRRPLVKIRRVLEQQYWGSCREHCLQVCSLWSGGALLNQMVLPEKSFFC